jgi:hypothetical protein
VAATVTLRMKFSGLVCDEFMSARGEAQGDMTNGRILPL